MKKRWKIVLITVMIIVGIIALIMTTMINTMNKKTKEALDKQNNVAIDMEQVADGIYSGSSGGGMINVEVLVEVKDHKIVNIDLVKHECGKGKPAESMVAEMLKKNTDDVDYVSGATGSSKTIRNAVNQALQSGMK